MRVPQSYEEVEGRSPKPPINDWGPSRATVGSESALPPANMSVKKRTKADEHSDTRAREAGVGAGGDKMAGGSMKSAARLVAQVNISR